MQIQTAVFYGASDDLVEVEGVKGGDEFPVGGTTAPDTKAEYMGSFNLGGKMRVHVIYDGCWSFAVGQVDEDIPLPGWPIRTGWSGGYTARLEIDAPDDVKVFKE